MTVHKDFKAVNGLRSLPGWRLSQSGADARERVPPRRAVMV